MGESTEEPTASLNRNANASAGSGAAVYGLGMIGAAVFYFQQAEGVWAYVFALPKAFVWPAFLVYEALTHLA